MKTEFKELDKILDLNIPQLILLASRPAMGKSTLAYNIARNIALNQNGKVLYFNLQDTRNIMINKLVSSEAEIEYYRIKKGTINIEEVAAIEKAKQKLLDSLIHIDSKSYYIDEICSMIRKECKKGVNIVFVDYLQLIKKHKNEQLNPNQIKVRAINELKNLSMELNIPIIVLSQLMRKTENRKNHRPEISDIKRVKNIINNIDTIMLLYRNDYYYSKMKDEIAEINIAKNINNRTGVIRLGSKLEYIKFVNI